MALGIFLSMPLTMNAQYDENRFGLQKWGGSNSVADQREKDDNQESGAKAPMGSGIAILMAAGAGYALLKKKADK